MTEPLIADTIEKRCVAPGTLTLHGDRDSSMRSRPLAAFFANLEVSITHSRQHVSDANPYSEAFSKRSNIGRPTEHASYTAHVRVIARRSFAVTTQFIVAIASFDAPGTVHYRHDTQLTEKRGAILMTTFAARPERCKASRRKHSNYPNLFGTTHPSRKARR